MQIGCNQINNKFKLILQWFNVSGNQFVYVLTLWELLL